MLLQNPKGKTPELKQLGDKQECKLLFRPKVMWNEAVLSNNGMDICSKMAMDVSPVRNLRPSE